MGDLNLPSLIREQLVSSEFLAGAKFDASAQWCNEHAVFGGTYGSPSGETDMVGGVAENCGSSRLPVFVESLQENAGSSEHLERKDCKEILASPLVTEFNAVILVSNHTNNANSLLAVYDQFSFEDVDWVCAIGFPGYGSPACKKWEALKQKDPSMFLNIGIGGILLKRTG